MSDYMSILDVVDRGIPNQERIPIFIKNDFYLQTQWVGLGVMQPDKKIFPINDNSFWLGIGWVKKGDWIFLYTGKGEPRINEIPNQETKIYTVHWNREKTLFNSPELHPYLLDGGLFLPPAFTAQNHVDDWFRKYIDLDQQGE